MYLYFKLPEDEEFAGAGLGGGFGIGYCAGSGVRSSWLAQDGEHWNPMSKDYKMAAEAIIQPNKANRNALVLHLPESGPSSDESDQPEELPAPELKLQSWPNPFNPVTRIEFVTSKAGPTQLDVYDIRGRRVAELARGAMESGTHEEFWNGRSQSGHTCASGVYFVRLETADGTLTERIVLLK